MRSGVAAPELAPSTAQRVGEAWRCAKRKAAVAGIPSSAAPSTAQRVIVSALAP